MLFFLNPETLGMNGPKEQTYKLVKEQKQSPGAGEKVERLENPITPLMTRGSFSVSQLKG